MRRIDRQQCIDELRAKMVAMTDAEHSMCRVAAEKGIYCKGVKQWTFAELKDRYDWIVASRPSVSRDQLERLANLWQLARQEVYGTKLACDTQSIEHDTCKGFDGFTDQELARFHRELCNEEVEVVPEGARPPAL